MSLMVCFNSRDLAGKTEPIEALAVSRIRVAFSFPYGVQVGAHPGLPDLQGFGRRRMAISPAEAEADAMYQIGALKAFCDAVGVPLHHVKPHGALYNMAARDPVLAAALCHAALPAQ